MKKVLLDTNGYSALLSGNQLVKDALEKAITVYISVFVLGELHAGFQGGTKIKENKETLERFLNKPSVQILPATSDTSEIFGVVKNNLRKQGTPIPINDVWIASHSLEIGATLITFDSHFFNVPNLILWDELSE